MKSPDPDAIAIGELFRKARALHDTPHETRKDMKPRQGSVTPIRLFSGKLSGSRNGKDKEERLDATACHWCRGPFQRGQMRYPILILHGCGWTERRTKRGFPVFRNGQFQPASLCMECFKCASPSDTGEPEPEIIDANSPNWAPPLPPRRPLAPRVEMKCPGCGEPIFVSPDFRWSLKFCSLRCYQRVYRKRGRRHGSTIAWKPDHRRTICEACKRPLPEGQRHDRRFCSNRCRQWTYRRRRQPAAP
jgi:hypothetical protein